MPKLLSALIVVVSISSAAFSQMPAASPTPTPKPGDDDVVKISTNLVQIDVTVTDKNGKVVRDLMPEDLEVYQNGKRQEISNFTFISSVREQTAENGEKRDVKRPQVVLPPSPVRPEQVRRTIALVVDDLSLSFESTYFARRALKKFVDEQMQDGDLVAIVRTGSGMGALQQFTNDKRQLYAAIERIRWNPMGTGQIGTFAAIEGKVDLGLPGSNQEDAEAAAKEQESTRTSIFAAGTLGAINYVVRGMQELPGRKSIMLISDGFKLYEEDRTGFKESGRVLEALRRLVDAANRAAVVIYTMDARGLVYTGLSAADDTSGRSPDQIEQELSDRRSQLFDTQDGLVYLAKQTGGTALINNNDLSGGIRKILDDQSYYLVGYVPDDETFSAVQRRFNKLEVKVRRPGLKVRYRSGFFGVTDERMSTAAAGPTGRNKLFYALTSPFGVGQIPLRLNAVFNTDDKGAAFVQSLLHIDLNQIKFTEQPDKKKQAVIDILVVAFGDNGMIIDQSGRSYTLSLAPDQYENLLRQGLVHTFTFPVKKPGAFQLRVAIRDQATDKVGSANQFVEVPNIKKDRILMSGVVLENIPVAEWERRNLATGPTIATTVLTDTSARQFKRGTVLNYGYTVFNAKPGSVEGGNLETQTRLFRDGKLIFEGKPKVAVPQTSRPKAANLLGSLLLGAEMEPGDYVLQVIATDKLASAKKSSASQFVQFEVLE